MFHLAVRSGWGWLMESVGLGPRWHGNSWQRGIAESGSSRPSTLMIDIPGDLVWDLPCMQRASCLEEGPLVWMLPLYLHVNQKSDYDDMIWWSVRQYFSQDPIHFRNHLFQKKKEKKKDPSYARELSNIIYALLFGYTKSAEASQDSVSRFVKLVRSWV